MFWLSISFLLYRRDKFETKGGIERNDGQQSENLVKQVSVCFFYLIYIPQLNKIKIIIIIHSYILMLHQLPDFSKSNKAVLLESPLLLYTFKASVAFCLYQLIKSLGY